MLQAAPSLSVSKPDHVTKHPQRLAPIGPNMGSRKLSHDISSAEADSVAAAFTADAPMSYKPHHTDPRDAAGGFQGLQNDVMPSSSAAESNVAHLSVSPLRLVSHVGLQPVPCCALLCCAAGMSYNHNNCSMRAGLLNCLRLKRESCKDGKYGVTQEIDDHLLSHVDGLCRPPAHQMPVPRAPPQAALPCVITPLPIIHASAPLLAPTIQPLPPPQGLQHPHSLCLNSWMINLNSSQHLMWQAHPVNRQLSMKSGQGKGRAVADSLAITEVAVSIREMPNNGYHMAWYASYMQFFN